jgi:signal transduction histidine kinase
MNRPSSKSIRARLTLWYVAVLALILAVYIAVVFFFQFALLERQMYHDEVQDIETVEALLFFDARGQLQLQQNYFVHPQNRLLVDRLLEVQDMSGRVLYRSSTLKDLPLDGEQFRGEGTDSFNERTTTLADGSHVFLISHVHPVEGHPVLIRLGYRLGPLESRMLQFALILLLGIPIALVAAAFAGYGIARKALNPLDEMASRAERITAKNLNERLTVENEDDELGHMARVLNHLLGRLERAFAELQRFTADAAHELRRPLASVRTTGELALERNEGAEELRETVSSMLEETIRLNQTIDGLLILARTEAHPTGETEEMVLLPELVGEILKLLGVVIEERRIAVSEEHDGHTEVPVCADRSFVRIAILNVLHNALKFSPPGSRLVIAYTAGMLESKPAERICITDAGPGIQAGEHERIFDRFYTSRNPDTQPNSGSGLGLSIAKLAMERSGGRIFFDKTATEGARCCIDLPVGTCSPQKK